MKRIIGALCLTMSLASIKVSAQHSDNVVFSGNIKNAENKELVLYDVYNNKTTMVLDNEGRFADTIQGPFVGHYRYIDAKNKLDIYFEKGKDLHVTYDAEDFKNTVVFSGAGAAVNSYILRKEVIRNEQSKKQEAESGINPFKLKELAFKQHYLRLKNALLKELSSTRGLSARYKRLENRNINYEYLYYISQYEPVRVNHLKDKNYQASKLLTDEMNGFVATNKEDFLFSEMYRNIIQSVYYEEAGEKSAADETPRDIAYLEGVSTIENAYIRNHLLYKFAASYFNFTQDLDGFYQAFMKGSSNEQDKAKVTEMYQTVKSVVANAVSPKFVDYENFAGGTSSLDDFKGKYVFIDIWATWCGPCVYEFPFLDKIEAAYKGKNIQFITLSIDTKANRQKWKDFVREKDLDGVQLLADNAFESAFIKAYNITAIPRFLLIDPKGNIVSNNAPRPSDPKLKELLDSLPL